MAFYADDFIISEPIYSFNLFTPPRAIIPFIPFIEIDKVANGIGSMGLRVKSGKLRVESGDVVQILADLVTVQSTPNKTPTASPWKAAMMASKEETP